MARVALTLLALALATAAPAAAGSRIYSSDTNIASPALAGDRMLFEQVPSPGFLRVSSLPVTGGSPTTLTTAKAVNRYSSVIATFAGSDQGVWVRRSTELGSLSMLTGPASGPLTSVEECTPDAFDFESVAVAAAGDVAVWAGSGCTPHRIRIQRGTASLELDAGDYVYGVAAGGNYAGWLRLVRPTSATDSTQTELVVVDATSGAQVYSTIVPQSNNLELEPDGTAIISTFVPGNNPCGGGTEQFLYYTRAEPVAHQVPNALSCDNRFRVANGRLAFVGADQSRTLGLINLDGTGYQPVAGMGHFPGGEFDFDGQRVAWSWTGCRDFTLHVRAATDTSAAEASPTCPVVVGKPRLARDRTIHVPIRCPNSCRSVGKLNGMTIVAPHFLHVWSTTRTTTRYAPYVHFNLKRGGQVTLKLPTTAHQRALIRRKKRVAVRLKIVAQNIYLPQIARTLTTFG